jgi:pimeloyl-ACP methyl ester carboxylesterase
VSRRDRETDPVAGWEALGTRVDVDGHEVWWCDLAPTVAPAGDPVLVLHGFPSSSFDWRHVVGPWRDAGRRVVLLDFLGFGLSDKPDVRYGIALHADCVEAVARAAGLERVVLVTHDMGDSVGGEVLARALDGALPFTVTRRVLSNGSIYLQMAQLTDGQKALMGAEDAAFDLASIGIDPGPAFLRGLAETFAIVPTQDELDAQWALMARDQGHTLLTRTIRYQEDRMASESRYTGAIETHPSPLRVVWGALDPIAVLPMTAKLLEARPDATLTVLDGVGHYPMIEAPERFGAAVAAGF